MHNVQCTLYNIQYTLYIIHNICVMQCINYIIYSVIMANFCRNIAEEYMAILLLATILEYVFRLLHPFPCECNVYCRHYTVYCILYTEQYIHYTVYCIIYSVYCILYIRVLYNIHYYALYMHTIYCIVYIIYYILYSVYTKQLHA